MSQYSFSDKDLNLIREKGISLGSIEIQIENFRKGFPPISLVAPATAGDGIIRLTGEEIREYAGKYQDMQHDLRIIKFIPASGAASRMFKSLFEFLNEDIGNTSGAQVDPAVREFIEGLDTLALTEELEALLRQKGKDLGEMISRGEIRDIVRAVLQGDGLNYGQLAKGLLAFHKYREESRTPLEEHMVEGAEYCQGAEGKINLHFTVSAEHLDLFRKLANQKQSVYEKRFGASYSIGFSLQQAFTDTIAVDNENHPFREADGSLLFRPGGHGALLANLNELDADLIFIKNIDNVCPDRMKPVTNKYKKALAGILLKHWQKAFEYIQHLNGGDYAELDRIENFLRNNLSTRLSKEDSKLQGKEKADLLKQKLNRPMRICGMVKNEGEPGGGPFWARNRDGSVSLQIVEPPQIDFEDEVQSGIARKSTHFNPVDLVCATRDYLANPFDLNKYVDPETGFISGKSQDGRSLKAQELPGLWNGSMSDWNTLFVEVPIETFNPVKTVNDLLRPEHRT